MTTDATGGREPGALDFSRPSFDWLRAARARGRYSAEAIALYNTFRDSPGFLEETAAHWTYNTILNPEDDDQHLTGGAGI